MSFSEYEDVFVWSCEKCDLTAQFPPNDFYGCVAEIKARGWLIERDSEGEWHHYCGRCRSKVNSAKVMDMPFSSIKRY
jgi:hypothetical protein